MVILRFRMRPPEPCVFVIFKPTNFKFWILIENYIKTNETTGFFDKLSISSGIELELGPSRIKVFFRKRNGTSLGFDLVIQLFLPKKNPKYGRLS
jgi:hypothetical protein